MGFKCGIVGLPNVGKSTLFNALTNSSKAQAANFPFCTIEPNVGVVPVEDERLKKLVEISKSKKKIYTAISFIDIAGLVKGASKGEGLGNKFLSHIREVDAIVHMIRCFDSKEIQNTNPDINPIRDLEIIETEMKLADIDSIHKRLSKKKNKKDSKDDEREILSNIFDLINENTGLEKIYEKIEYNKVQSLGLLSTKPRIYICNVDETSILNGNKYTENFINKFGQKNTIVISAEIENQINSLSDEDKYNYMKMLNIDKTGLSNLIFKGYKLLNLETFFTSGEEESRAWTIKKNSKAPAAAGIIHSDFEKGFIRAETVSFEDFVNCKGWNEAKSKGKLRLEGKDYVVQDGDVLNFRFNT